MKRSLLCAAIFGAVVASGAVGAAALQDKLTQVTERIAALKDAGITLPAETNPTDHVIDESRGDMFASSASTIMEGREFFQLTLNDDANKVDIFMSRMAGDFDYSLDAIHVDGVPLQEPAALQVGRTFTYANPALAEVALQEQMLQGRAGDPVAGGVFSPITMTPDTTGVTIFFHPEDSVIVLNREAEITYVAALLPAQMREVAAAPLILQAQQQPRVTPRQRVCDRLFNICMTHQNEVGIRACEAWLKYCAPPAGANN